jgi:hypothetical protein
MNAIVFCFYDRQYRFVPIGLMKADGSEANDSRDKALITAGHPDPWAAGISPGLPSIDFIVECVHEL